MTDTLYIPLTCPSSPLYVPQPVLINPTPPTTTRPLPCTISIGNWIGKPVEHLSLQRKENQLLYTHSAPQYFYFIFFCSTSSPLPLNAFGIILFFCPTPWISAHVSTFHNTSHLFNLLLLLHILHPLECKKALALFSTQNPFLPPSLPLIQSTNEWMSECTGEWEMSRTGWCEKGEIYVSSSNNKNTHISVPIHIPSSFNGATDRQTEGEGEGERDT